jgi:hypothetical protein
MNSIDVINKFKERKLDIRERVVGLDQYQIKQSAIVL